MEEPVTFGRALGYASDAKLVAAVAEKGFEGTLRIALEHQLWLYGWRVMRGMVRDLSILRVKTNLPPMFIDPDDYHTLQDSAEQREQLVLDTLALAVPFMINQLRKGRWDPQRSGGPDAKLGTYFTTACAMKFRDVYQAWHRRRVKEIRAWLAMTETAVYAVHDPYDVVSDRFRLQQILKNASLVDRLICMGILADKSHADIAKELGITVGAVRGRLYRLRQRTWKNLGAAPIVRKRVSA
ncbi:sigma factor-like helix-turn-helix DNA-binding protein [Nocardia sp. NPDC052001]|uniref:RNA polymerase sigma factor n=1 Tax=Nocardia sp. NPDC052001 TaxID=3154853 RepID=UPI003433BA67